MHDQHVVEARIPSPFRPPCDRRRRYRMPLGDVTVTVPGRSCSARRQGAGLTPPVLGRRTPTAAAQRPSRPVPAPAGREIRAPGPGTGWPPVRRRRACPAAAASRCGSNRETQPMPRPSARAASHRFWIAHDTDARSICGSVRRPKTCRSRSSPSATTKSSAQSRMPSTLSARNSSARSPRACGGARALFVDEGVNASPQQVVGDPDEAPRLHQADTGRGVRCLQQARQHVVGYHTARHEPAHVAAFGDHPVDGPPLLRIECVIAHKAMVRIAAVERCGEL